MPKTFKDNINNIGSYVYSVYDNGDVFINYDYNIDYFIGNYSKYNELPKDEYVWDLDSIPQVKEFHNWIAENFIQVKEFISLKEHLNELLEKSNSKADLKNIYESLNNVFNKEEDIEVDYDFSR